jgi:hypothetical protein
MVLHVHELLRDSVPASPSAVHRVFISGSYSGILLFESDNVAATLYPLVVDGH